MTPTEDDDFVPENNGSVPDEDTYSAENVEACCKKIGMCFADVTQMLDGDFWTATDLFRTFVAEIRLPKEHRRNKPNPARDEKLLADYNAAKRGTRAAILLQFENHYELAEGSAIQIIRRNRRHSAARVFDPAIKRLLKKGDN